MDGMNDQAGMSAGDSQDQSLMDSILGTSEGTSDPAGSSTGTSGQTGGNGQPYTFAGRQWKGGQTEAEKWANKLYGEFSQKQGTLKAIKEAFENDPESLQEAAKDPKWAAILGKLGIQAAREEADEAEAEAEQLPNDPQERLVAMERQIGVRMAQLDLRDEKSSFESSLGRKMTQDENNAVMGVIQRAPSLTIEEAFNVCYHKKLMEEQAKKTGQQTKPSNGRPKPPPTHIPGLKTEGGKNTKDMGAGEFREFLKNTAEFQGLMSREG